MAAAGKCSEWAVADEFLHVTQWMLYDLTCDVIRAWCASWVIG